MKTYLFLILGLALSLNANAIDLKEVEKQLTTTGVEGWIHGSVADQGLYVFTYRSANDFFDYVEMSLVAPDLVPGKPDIAKQLKTLTRHDKVRIKGSFLDNPSPQKHISVTSIEILKPFQNPYPSDPYQHEAKLPDDLLNKSTATFLIHAIAGDGHILVAEYKDSICPIYVKNADLTKNLFRNDVVQLNFKIAKDPDHPMHLRLLENAPEPVKVLDSIQAKHGKPAVVEGALILFPKSPEIVFNVFAVQEQLPEGLSRQYTLVNFEDQAVFAKIRGDLQKAWDKYPGEYVNGRNKFVSKRIRVRATGTFNEVSDSQANPQILLKTVDSIQIIEH
jgi:hypothetical protein